MINLRNIWKKHRNKAKCISWR